MPNDVSRSATATDVDHEWWDGEGQLYLAWGILNPYGPTLYVLGARREANGRRRVFMRALHMLGGRTTYAAEAVAESRISASTTMRRASTTIWFRRTGRAFSMSCRCS
jgi:hypothetical protein